MHGHTAARVKASGMAITGMAPEPKATIELWRFIKSVHRSSEDDRGVCTSNN
jgi:poly(3-hydroxybutyrate) depolymerase